MRADNVCRHKWAEGTEKEKKEKRTETISLKNSITSIYQIRACGRFTKAVDTISDATTLENVLSSIMAKLVHCFD